jgi:hypothetical protein
MDKIEKINDTSIQITTQPVMPDPVVKVYDRTFTENQIIQIQKQLDDYTSARQAELDECNNILSQMDSLGIIAKPVEIVAEPPIMTPPIKL